MKTFEIRPGNAGQMSSLLRPSPDYVDAVVLSANTAVTHNCPTGAQVVLFSGTTNFYAKPGAAASVPAAEVTDGTAPELNPVGWTLPANDRITQITFNAPASCTVSICFYK